MRYRDVVNLATEAPEETQALRRLVEANGDPSKVRQVLTAASGAADLRTQAEQILEDDPWHDEPDERQPYPEAVEVESRRDGELKDAVSDEAGRRVQGTRRYRPRNRPSTRKPTTRDIQWLSEEMDERRQAAGVTDQQWEALKLVKGRGLRPVQVARRMRVSRQRVSAMVKESLAKLGVDGFGC